MSEAKNRTRTPLWERLARDWISAAPPLTRLSLRDLAGPIFATWSDEDLLESGILGAATYAVERLEGVRIHTDDEVRALRIVRGAMRQEGSPPPAPRYVVEVLEEQARLWDEGLDEDEIDAAVDALCEGILKIARASAPGSRGLGQFATEMGVVCRRELPGGRHEVTVTVELNRAE
jgi:Zn-dependent protease with chaperone function